MLTWRRWVTVVVLLGAACAPFQVYRIKELRVPSKTGRLDNGMRVVVQPDPSMSKVYVGLRYDVGAAHDPKDKKGLAHLVEHLAFRVGDELVQKIERDPVALEAKAVAEAIAKKTGDGAKANPASAVVEGDTQRVQVRTWLSDDDAHTSLDETYYWQQSTPANVDNMLNWLTARMGDFSPRIQQEVFEAEREVVRNERRQSYEAGLLDRWPLDLFDHFYPQEHPYQGAAVIGAHDTIASVTLDDVGAFLRRHYHPANATLTVVGPVDVDATYTKISTLFGPKVAGTPSRLPKPEWTPAYHEKEITVEGAKETLLVVAWPMGPSGSSEHYAMDLLDSLTGGWFHWSMVKKREWANYAHAWVQPGEIESMFVVAIGLKDSASLEDAKEKVFEIAPLMRNVLDSEDVAKARRQKIYQTLYGLEEPQERAQWMAWSFAHLGTPYGWDERIKTFEELHLDTVQEAARRVMQRDRAFVLTLRPDPATEAKLRAEREVREAEDKDAETAALDEARAAVAAQKKVEALGKVRDFKEDREALPSIFRPEEDFQEFKRWALAATDHLARWEELTLKNGMRARVSQVPGLPIMHVAAVALGGGIAEGDRRAGAPDILASVMGLSGSADREQRWRMAVGKSYDVGVDFVSFKQWFPSFYAATGLRLFANELFSPAFTRAGVLAGRDQWLAEKEKGDEYTGMLGTRAYWTARGAQRFAALVTRDSLKDVGYAEVRDYYDRVVYPENIVLSVASDLPVAQVKGWLEQHFGGVERAERAPLTYDELNAGSIAPAPAKVIVVPTDAEQTYLALAFDASGWADWRQSNLENVVAELLEDKLAVLRKVMGVTYGVSASPWRIKDKGVVWVSAKVERDATDVALKQLHKLTDEFARTELTQGDLEKARRNILMRYAPNQLTKWATSQDAIWKALMGRPDDHERQVIEWASTITVDDLRAARAKLFQSGTVVVSGKEPDWEKAKGTVLEELASSVKVFKPDELL